MRNINTNIITGYEPALGMRSCAIAATPSLVAFTGGSTGAAVRHADVTGEPDPGSQSCVRRS